MKNLEEEAEKAYPIDLGHESVGSPKTDGNEKNREIWKSGATSAYAKEQVTLGQIKVLEDADRELKKSGIFQVNINIKIQELKKQLK